MSMLPKKYGKSHFHKKENVVYLAQHDCFLNEKELALRPEIAANGRQSPTGVWLVVYLAQHGSFLIKARLIEWRCFDAG